MRIVLVGRTGQVGWELERCLMGLGELAVLGRAQLDLADAANVGRLESQRPDVIVNAAAYTDVEGAESNEAAARAVNATSVAALAGVAKRTGATLVHYSTDYVYDGTKPDPYVETDATHPLSVYGRTKLEGEDALRAAGCAHVILRTSWVYAARGRNFVRTILRAAAQRPELRIVADQHGAPTSARLIAQVTALMVRALGTDPAARARAAAGQVVHLTAGGATTWFGFAQAMRESALALDLPFGAQLVPIRTDEYPTKARRPANSRLDLSRLERDWGIAVPPWQTGLRLVMEDIAAAAKDGR